MSADVDILMGERTFTGIIYSKITALAKVRTYLSVGILLAILPSIAIILRDVGKGSVEDLQSRTLLNGHGNF